MLMKLEEIMLTLLRIRDKYKMESHTWDLKTNKWPKITECMNRFKERNLIKTVRW